MNKRLDMDENRESVRESPKQIMKVERLQSESLEGSSTEDVGAHDISIVGGIEEIEASPYDGVFDGTKISSVFEVNEREDVAFKNAVARSEKRFEMALGLSLLKKEYFDLKPVSLQEILRNDNDC